MSDSRGSLTDSEQVMIAGVRTATHLAKSTRRAEAEEEMPTVKVVYHGGFRN